MPRFLKLAAAVLSAVVCGCATYDSPFVHKTEAQLDEMEQTDSRQAKHFASGRYHAAHSTLSSLRSEPTVSRPLYDLEEVSILLQQGKNRDAHELLVKFREDLELLQDKNAEEKAVSLWHGENNKVFKGDCHEISTFYALLAMSFMELGEWDDAERCVKNGLLADSSNEKKNEYNSDFALLQYLGFVSCLKAGRESDADEYSREMRVVLKGLNRPVSEDSSSAILFDKDRLPNAFLVLWTGTPPSYARGGEYEEIRHVIPGESHYSHFTVDGGDGVEYVMPSGLANINFQAITRGGREMDNVLRNKARIKTGMAASGNILLVVGYGCFASMGSDAQSNLVLGCVGGGCILAGCTFHIVGAMVNSRADIRHWKNLPGEMLIIPLVVPEGEEKTLTIRGYQTADNLFVREVRVKGGENGTVATRHFSVTDLNGLANPATDDIDEAVKAVKQEKSAPSRLMRPEIYRNSTSD